LWAVGTSSKPTSQHLFGGMDGSCFFSLPDHHSLFFFFFLGTHCRHQVKTRRHNPGHQDKDTCGSGSHSGCGTFVNSIGEEIWLSGSDRSFPGANEVQATGRAALTLISGYARLSEDRPAAEGYADRALGGRSGCLDQFINHLARPAPSPARRKRPS
jgi:hypothetical protein